MLCIVVSKDLVASAPLSLAVVANRNLLAFIVLHNTSVADIKKTNCSIILLKLPIRHIYSHDHKDRLSLSTDCMRPCAFLCVIMPVISCCTGREEGVTKRRQKYV